MSCILSSPIQAVALHLGSGCPQLLSTGKPQEEVLPWPMGLSLPPILAGQDFILGASTLGSAGGGMLVLWPFSLASALVLPPSQYLGESS